MTTRIGRRLAGLALCLMLALVAWPGLAQQGAVTAFSEPEIEALIEQARDKGVEIMIVAPSRAAQASERPRSQMAGIHETASAFRAELQALLTHLPKIPGDVTASLAAASPSGAPSYFAVVLAGLLAIMLVAAALEWVYGRWVREKMRASFPQAPDSMPDKMTFLAVRFLVRVFGFLLFGLISLALAAAVFESEHAVELTVLIAVGSVVAVRTIIEFWRVWITPNLPAFRLPDLDDEAADRLFRWLTGSAVLSGVLISVCLWMHALGIDERGHRLLLILAGVVMIAYHLVMIGRTRAIVAGLILGKTTAPERVPRLRRLFANNWHLILGGYFLAAWLSSNVRFVIGDAAPIGPGAGMVFILMATLTIYCIAVVLLDWVFYRRAGAKAALAAEAPVVVELEVDDSPGGGPGDAETADEDFVRGVHSFEDLAKQFVTILLVCFVAGGLLAVWGVDLADQDSPLVRLWDVALILVLGYVAYQSARILIERRMAAEGGAQEPEPGAEGSAGGASRLATLLPLFRSFILITIVVFTVMIGLSELGIDIAPLFAGAGVIGLAIGFGAQALIRDIFSGAFFLFDDAFRKGEYINIGDVQGTVERISLRSMQVRHHNGPLHTVPFGEIRHLTNFSRDWVMMKLKIRVTYDTDVERLRKLIKKLGQELLQHPEIGDKFLEPLKSQGIYAMDDSAMIVRMKFMTKPGDQFDVRKIVYARIREIFEQEGIKFAHREVTVRVADPSGERRLSEAEKKEIAGAATPLLEAPQGGPNAPTTA